MRKYFAVVSCLFSCFLAFLITGCAQEKIVEDLGFIHSAGYDLNEAENAAEEGVLILTTSLPQVAPTAEKHREVLTTIAHTSKQGRAKMARKTDRVLVSGQLRTALFGYSLAEKGIFDTMDTLNRDYSIGLNLKVIVVDGSCKELLINDYPEHPRTGRYIYELIDKEAKARLTVSTSLHDFMRDYYDDGIDVVAPVIKQGKNEIIVDGIGIFKEDQLVMKIDPKESRVFMMLHGDYLGGDLTKEIKLKEEKKESYLYITFTTLESKRKITVKSPSDIIVNLEVKGTIDEYTGNLELTDDDVQKEIEQKLAEFIEGVSVRLLKEIQAKQADSIGLGKKVRNSLDYKTWKEMNWKETIYPDANIEVHVNVKLKGFGSVK